MIVGIKRHRPRVFSLAKTGRKPILDPAKAQGAIVAVERQGIVVHIVDADRPIGPRLLQHVLDF